MPKTSSLDTVVVSVATTPREDLQPDAPFGESMDGRDEVAQVAA